MWIFFINNMDIFKVFYMNYFIRFEYFMLLYNISYSRWGMIL